METKYQRAVRGGLVLTLEENFSQMKGKFTKFLDNFKSKA